MTDSKWDDLTPKSKNNAFNTGYVIGSRIDSAREQFFANSRKRATKEVEKMRAKGIEPSKSVRRVVR